MVGWETYLERLGPQGLRLVVAGVLDEQAAAGFIGRPLDGLSPAERGRLIVETVADRPASGPALLEALDLATKDADPGPRDEAGVRDVLAVALRAPDLGAAHLLHQLARPARALLAAAELRAAGEILAAEVLGEDPGTRPKWLARSASERAGLRELEQERRELEARVRQLEAQQGRLVERSGQLEDELAKRLAETQQLRLADRAAREERARLEREVARLEKRIEDFNERRAREGTGVVATALRRLTTEQRKTAAQLEKLRKAGAEKREAERDQARRLATLGELVDKLAVQRDADVRSGAAAQEAILRTLNELRGALGNGFAPPREDEGARRRPVEGLPRVGLFVDVQNMFYGARERGARLDVETLLAAASSGRQLVRAVAYLVESRDIDQSAFIHLLQAKKYEVKRKPLRVRTDGSMKGNWDLEMALDALITAEHLDVVVLATGDGDFVPLVRQLKLRGLRVEVYGFPRSSAPDLREAADRFVAITRKLLRPLAPEKRGRPLSAPNGSAPPAEPQGVAADAAPGAGPDAAPDAADEPAPDMVDTDTLRTAEPAVP